MSLPNHTAAKDLENKLFPPAGTSFFESETITVFDEVELTRPSGLGATSHVETLTWRPEVYKYVTRAKPDDPQFQEHGGIIYIILVHGGLGRTGDTSSALGYDYVQSIKVPPTVIPVKQYPASHTGTQSGDDWAYSIGYTQMMTMFANGGNTATDFEAYYHEDFTRHQSQQTGAETSDGVEFAVHFEENINFVDFPIVGFSVFKCFDPTIFPVTFTFEASTGVRRDDGYTADARVTQDVPIDFKFT
ncbi:hypothetical protein EYR36_009941 [Pleurotus pulmonarius]|nr:hypothetical protein EYR36_009941 [Pleurotus pulmonarius]KAF4593419.1 hypothetical protein EYR38_009133 [Pleurotus pulmonarius]